MWSALMSQIQNNLLAFLLAFFAFGLLGSQSGQVSTLEPATKLANDRSHVVIVRPVVLCDNDGKNPAAIRLPKELVDQVYTKADLEFIYLPKRTWHYEAGRKGEVNLDTIVRKGFDQGVICKDPRIVTLLFVSGIDGRQGPLGRGLQNGNICFVSLGPNPAENDPAMEAFVLAHEVGHCLDLYHAVDDDLVPNDVPNLQGDGEYSERLAVEGLHDSQRDTVLKSPLVNAHVRFYTKEEAADRIVDETWERYVSDITPDMLRFSLGLKASDSLPSGPELQSKYTQLRFADSVEAFTEAEQRLLRAKVQELTNACGDDWPIATRFPWNFLKVKEGFCSDFPHTRGLSIVLTSAGIARIEKDRAHGLKLLLHEKIHVLQRVLDQEFEQLYRDFGYKEIKLEPGATSSLNFAQNPDAFSKLWAFPANSEEYLLGTLLKTKGVSLTFNESLFRLKASEDGIHKIAETVDVGLTKPWKLKFPIRTGHDHPKEVAAYLSGRVFGLDYLNEAVDDLDQYKSVTDLTREFFNQNFSLAHD